MRIVGGEINNIAYYSPGVVSGSSGNFIVMLRCGSSIDEIRQHLAAVASQAGVTMPDYTDEDLLAIQALDKEYSRDGSSKSSS